MTKKKDYTDNKYTIVNNYDESVYIYIDGDMNFIIPAKSFYITNFIGNIKDYVFRFSFDQKKKKIFNSHVKIEKTQNTEEK